MAKTSRTDQDTLPATKGAAKKGRKAGSKAASLANGAPVRGAGKAKRQPVRKRERRLAEVVAEKIEEDIIAQDWPIGAVVGSESDLLERYNVSRSVLRQAVRLLEHHQVARMRPGPNSGLIVTEPSSAATLRALNVYLRYCGVSVREILEAKRALEMMCVQLAAERITSEGVKQLRAAIEQEKKTPNEEIRTLGENNIHILLAKLTGNPALHLFVEVLTQLSMTHAPANITDDTVSRTFDAHAEVAEAVISGDVALAMHAMRSHLDDVEETLGC